MATLGEGLTDVATVERWSAVYALGHASGAFYVQRSTNRGASLAALNANGDLSIYITDGDQTQPGFTALSTGILVAAIPVSGTIVIWQSKTGGATWEQVDTLS